MTQPENCHDDNDLLSSVLTASGGLDAWRKTKEIHVKGIFSGPLLKILSNIDPKIPRTLVIKPDKCYVKISDFPEKGYTGLWLNQEVQILENKTGKIDKNRLNPKKYFTTFGWGAIRRLFHWDHLDVLYFVGYAVWNYFLTPYIFTSKGVKHTEVTKEEVFNSINLKIQEIFEHHHQNSLPPEISKKNYRIMKVSFPEGFPTHCCTQTFVYDRATCLLAYEIYKLDISGPIGLEAKNLAKGYKMTKGEVQLNFFKKREVYLKKIFCLRLQFLGKIIFFKNMHISALHGDIKSVKIVPK